MPAIPFRRLHWALWVVPVALLLSILAVHGIIMLMPAPSGLDMSRHLVSENGTFTAEVEPGTVVVGEAMTWTFAIKSNDGTPIDAATLSVDGGMPLHGHGLPRAPATPRALGGDRFSVDGIVFSMTGWWQVNVHRDTAQGSDQATFNFVL